MAAIPYELHGFRGRLPNGLPATRHGRHSVTPSRLVWAAVTVGTTPFGPRHRQSALELQWRAAMMRASIEQNSKFHTRSTSYARLDPSEKGAVSFFLGQAQAKLFAHDFFRVSRFVHYDSFLASQHSLAPRRRTRPDFIGFHGRRTAIAVEAKGRSQKVQSGTITAAKAQVRSLPLIHGHGPTTSYVHAAHFDGDRWCAHLEDPPRQRSSRALDPAAITSAYYLPIVSAMRGRDPQVVPAGRTESQFVSSYFADADISVLVRSDIWELAPAFADEPARRSDLGAGLYELVLQLDADSDDAPATLGESSGPMQFIGGDGVGIVLGGSWESWAYGVQE